MINYETLLSSYDDKLTLMQWLKKVEEALKGASAVSFKVNKRGDATLTFSVVFEDGSELETGPIILQQGESVQGAAIRNGHLILTLTNGDELDAGDLGAVSGFSINASQHLVVTYQNGTTQDLGAIFTGDVTLAGNLTAAAVKTASLTSDEGEIAAQKPVVEVMEGYSFAREYVSGTAFDIGVTYAGAVKNGNKLTLSLAFTIKRKSDDIDNYFPVVGNFTIPSSLFNRLVPDVGDLLDAKRVILLTASTDTSPVSLVMASLKYSGKIHIQLGRPHQIPLDTIYYSRYEVTFLLSDNMAA